MAIGYGAGTEVIRSHLFEVLPGTAEKQLLIGEQHHVYTILSMSVYCRALNGVGDTFSSYITGFDAYGGTSDQDIYLFKQTFSAAGETFVFDNRISFMGFEPLDDSGGTSVVGVMNTATEQDALLLQASAGSVPQKLFGVSSHASTTFDVTLTFIDQNWS